MPTERTVLALGAAAFAVAGEARAWTTDASASVSAPCPAAATALVVVAEEVELDCRESTLDALACSVSARYTVHNPTTTPQHAALRVQGETLALDGAAPSEALELAVPPGARATFVMRGERRRVIDRPWFRPWYRLLHGAGALELAHPFLAQSEESAVRISLDYQRARRCVGAAGWAAAGLAVVRSHAPRRWVPTVGYEQRGLCRVGDGITCTQVEETDNSYLQMNYERPTSAAVRGGGVTVGLGGTVGQGFRARLGYEAGIGRRVLTSASVEFDTSGNVVLTPALGVAIPLWRIYSWNRSWLPGALVPWVGAPLGVAPDLRGGVRGQLSLLWLFAGLDGAVDYYPRDGRVDVTVMVRLGI